MRELRTVVKPIKDALEETIKRAKNRFPNRKGIGIGIGLGSPASSAFGSEKRGQMCKGRETAVFQLNPVRLRSLLPKCTISRKYAFPEIEWKLPTYSSKFRASITAIFSLLESLLLPLDLGYKVIRGKDDQS